MAESQYSDEDVAFDEAMQMIYDLPSNAESVLTEIKHLQQDTTKNDKKKEKQ